MKSKFSQPGENLQATDWASANLAPFEKNFYTESSVVAARPRKEIDDFLKEHSVKVEGEDFPRPVFNFEETNFPENLVRSLKAQFSQPTVIQSLSWPVLLGGRDFIGIAQTGSGKTLAFMLPAMVHILNQQPLRRGDGPMVLVLCPTRELAQQCQQVMDEFGRNLRIRNVCVFGGAPRGNQLRQLRQGVEMVVATPGRLLDFLESGSVNLNRCTYLVLDEADRMLDMGFEPQIRKIIEQIRPDRQTVMFSATWPREVQQLANEFLKGALRLKIGSSELMANRNITQVVCCVEEHDKGAKLKELMEEVLKEDKTAKVLIFVETKRKADDLTWRMKGAGWPVLAIHGDKGQAERDWVLKAFRSGRTSILIATDVAARGLDVDDVKYVVNYDFPQSCEDYVHRIGRTGRRDKTGTAYTFLTSTNRRVAGELIGVLEGAGQEVPAELRQMAQRSRGFGGGPQRGNWNRFGRYGGRGGNGGYGGFDRGFGGKRSADESFGDHGDSKRGKFGGHVKW